MPRVQCLFVAEKPSIARTLAEVLSRGQARHRTTVSQSNPCFDFDLDAENIVDGSLPDGGRQMSVIVTSVRGHLMAADFDGHYQWSTTPQRELFDAPIKRFVPQDQEMVAKNITNEARRSKILVIWTDCDREGEAIGEEILSQCRQVNARMICKRARFSAANAPDLWRAVNSLRPLDQREVDAVQARSEIDLRLGAVFTRFQTLSLQNRIPAMSEKIVSFGPCQFPTLGFIVSRYESILSFEKETFWQIQLAITSTAAPQQQHAQGAETTTHSTLAQQQSNQIFYFNWGRFRLFDQALAVVAYELCVQHSTATVFEVARKPTSKWRPVPLSTVELQVRASRWLRIDSEAVMRAAESLYQRGIISYPRTETEVFTESFDLRSIVNEFRSSPQYGAFAIRLLDEDGFQHPRAGSKNDQAHPPIHPLKFVSDLTSQDEIRVYEFVCRHFLACCARDAVGAESTVRIKLAGETFSTKGLVVHERNFLDVYPYERWGDKSIPDLKEGDTFVPEILNLTQGETSPPDLLTEADLIRLMDKNGIGTDATIQDHIKTVQERGYAQKLPESNNRFMPTNLGVALVRAYNHMGHESAISRPELRSEMERDLARICRGEKSKAQVIRETVDKYRQVFLDVLKKREILLEFVHSSFMGADDVMDGQEEGGGEDDAINGLCGYDEISQQNISNCGACGTKSMGVLRRARDKRVGIKCFNSACPKSHVVFSPLPANGAISVRPDGFTCPICAFQVLQCNGSWSFCPSCYVNPPAQGGIDLEDLASMPCFRCAKKDCQLATFIKEDPVMPCPTCRSSELILRKRTMEGQPSSFYLGCKSYPTCKGSLRLPKSIKEASRMPIEKCSKCQAHKLAMVLDRNRVPPGTPSTLTECPNFLQCSNHSVDFRQVLEMENLFVIAQQRPQQSHSLTNMHRGGGSATTQVARGPPVFSSGGSQQHVSATQQPQARGPVPQQARGPPIQPRRTAGTVSMQHQFHGGAAASHSSLPSNTRGSSSSSLRGSSHQGRGNRASNPGDDQTRTCPNCATMLTMKVSETQKNPGRRFYKCDCGFFEWADGAPSGGGRVGRETAFRDSAGAGNQNSFRVDMRFSSSRGGGENQSLFRRGSTAPPPPNPRSGALLPSECYHCGSRDHLPVQCPQSNPIGLYAGGPRAALSNNHASNPTLAGSSQGNGRANDTCYKCNQPGHWANQCPNNGSSFAPQAGRGSYNQAAVGVAPNSRGYGQNPGRGGVIAGTSRGGARGSRTCANCRRALAPRKRKCEGCGTMTTAPKRGSSNRGGSGVVSSGQQQGADYEDEEDDDVYAID